MEATAHYKIILLIVLIITSPIWLYLSSIILKFLFNYGRILGTIIRYVSSIPITMF